MANRYWVGGTASWDNTAGTKWSLTDGGAGGEAVPTSSDDVFFTALSGAVTVSVATANGTCQNLDFTGFTGTFENSGITKDVFVTGNFTLGSGMTNNFIGAFRFSNTSGSYTITTNGIQIVGFNGFYFDANYGYGGTWTLQDDVTFYDSGSYSTQLAFKGGILDCNNKNLNFTGVDSSFDCFSPSGAGVSKILMGTGTWTFSGTNSQWFDNGTTVYIDGTNATVVFSGTGDGSSQFSYYINNGYLKTLTLNSSATNPYFKFLGSYGGCAIGTLNVKRGYDIVFDADYTFNFLTAINLTGTNGVYTNIHTNSLSNRAYLRYLNGTSISLDYLKIRDIQVNYFVDDQYTISTPTFGLTALTAGKTTLVLADDASSSAINLGFTFTFYGQNFTQCYISSNGALGLSASIGSRKIPYRIPDPLNNNGFIAGFFKDLNPAAGGTIEYETQGSSPNRVFIAYWNGVYEFGTTSPCTFQIKLYETSNLVEIHASSCTNTNYLQIPQQGMESPDATTGTYQNERNQASFILTNDAVRYTPSTSGITSIDWSLSNSDDLGNNIGLIFVGRQEQSLRVATAKNDPIDRGPAIRSIETSNAPGFALQVGSGFAPSVRGRTR